MIAVAATYYFFFGKGEKEQTLIIAVPEEIESTDIQQVSWENIVHDAIFQPLVRFDMDCKTIVPDLAVRYEVSGKNLTFYLPEGVKFSSGNPITADIIKRSIERYRRLSIYAEDYAVVEDIVVVNDYTITLVCKEPPAYLWAVLTTIYGAPVDVKTAEKIGDEAFGLKAVGSGPFKVVKWVQGSHIEFERNDNYKTNLPFVKNHGPPKIKKLVVRFIPEDLTRISELEAGKVHIVIGVPTEAIKRLEKNPDIKLYYTLTPGIDYIMINCKRAPLNDVNVRKAISLAINRSELVKALEDTAVPYFSLLSPTQICYNETLEKYYEKVYSYNPQKASKILESLGWKDTDGDGILDKDGKPFTVTLLVPVDRPVLRKVAPLIQAQLSKIGIKVELQEFEYRYIRDKTRNWDFDLALRAYVWSDPDILFYIFHSVENYTWSDPEVDELLEEARTIMDMTERTEVYSRIQTKILDDCAVVPLFVTKSYIAARKEVKGLIVHPMYGELFLNDVELSG